MLTKEQCQKKLFYLGIKYGVDPKAISTRLLSSEDKQDIVEGLITDETLDLHVKCWKEAGTPDYAKGSDEPYKRFY